MPLSFALEKEFTGNHQINLVFEDLENQQAIFVTQSSRSGSNPTDNSLIDSVTLLKLVAVGGGKLEQKQVTLELPEKQVNTQVFSMKSNNKDTIDFLCFYQKPDYLSVISCKPFSIIIDSCTIQEGELIDDVVKNVLIKDPTASSLIGEDDLTNINLNVFRFKQSLDD